MEKSKRLKKNARYELDRLYRQIVNVLVSDDEGEANLHALIPCLFQFCQHYLWCKDPYKLLLK